jgi:acyl-CoA reductase-like NAD-dependent aldehyde dehydrogenase
MTHSSEITPCLLPVAPASGSVLASIPIASPQQIAQAAAQARSAQLAWSQTPLGDRVAFIQRWHDQIAARQSRWIDLLAREIGKPHVETLSELAATLDQLRWLARHARACLRSATLQPAWQRFMLLGKARVRYAPKGLIGILGTWNYPLLLNAPVLAGALLAGNAVLWKPSESASLSGAALQQSLLDAAPPPNLAACVFGGPEVGRALIASGIDHLVYTGGVAGGRAALQEAGSRGIPATIELAGFDPALILPDAPLESTIPPLLWAAFAGAGQTCVAIKRIYVIGPPRRARAWAEALARRAALLRLGDPASSNNVDIGPLISLPARDRFLASIQYAAAAGAEILTGGRAPDIPGAFALPTVLWTESERIEPLLEGIFGPVVLVRPVPDPSAAIAAANASNLALAASIWGKNRKNCRDLARRIHAGIITINDAVTPSAHAAAPFGGVKSSGFGRVHGPHGLLEFVHPVATHERPLHSFRPHIFPYSHRGLRLVEMYLRLFHSPPRITSHNPPPSSGSSIS